MGDNPIPKDNGIHACPIVFWPDGLEPDIIVLTVTDILKGNAWSGVYPEPPNGVFPLAWSSCGHWVFWDSYFVYALQISALAFTFRIYGTVPQINSFYWSGSAQENMSGDSFVNDGNGYYYGGSFAGSLSRLALPRSWDAADLVGVPKVAGYKAEELPTSLADRKCRYANHFDGTNIKVYFNE